MMHIFKISYSRLNEIELQVSGSFTAEYVEFEVKRAFEWLGGEKNEGRRHAAVSFLPPNQLAQ